MARAFSPSEPIVDERRMATRPFSAWLRTLGTAGGEASLDWVGITGKPSTFPPSLHSHPVSDVTDFAEAVDDRVGALCTAGANMAIVYDDAAGTLTFSAASAGGGSFPLLDMGLITEAAGAGDTVDMGGMS